LKEEALNRTVWRNRFGGCFEPVNRQNSEWMNEWTYLLLGHSSGAVAGYVSLCIVHRVTTWLISDVSRTLRDLTLTGLNVRKEWTLGMLTPTVHTMRDIVSPYSGLEGSIA
jgi:hypothetical protein